VRKPLGACGISPPETRHHLQFPNQYEKRHKKGSVGPRLCMPRQPFLAFLLPSPLSQPHLPACTPYAVFCQRLCLVFSCMETAKRGRPVLAPLGTAGQLSGFGHGTDEGVAVCCLCLELYTSTATAARSNTDPSLPARGSLSEGGEAEGSSRESTAEQLLSCGHDWGFHLSCAQDIAAGDAACPLCADATASALGAKGE
jgi:hypothetical protein